MDIVVLVILFAAFVVLCFLVYLKIKAYTLQALFFKTSLSVLFILMGVWGATRPLVQEAGLGTLAFFILAGLVMGLLGDIWLDQRRIHDGHLRMYTLAGFSSFGVGHIFYFCAIFFCLVNAEAGLLFWPVLGGAIMVLVMKIIEKPLHMDYESYRTVVLVYTFIITVATLLPLVILLTLQTAQPQFVLVFALGMSLFLLSDLVLSQSYFSTRKMPEKVFTPLNYLLYYGGQFLIASSLLMLAVE